MVSQGGCLRTLECADAQHNLGVAYAEGQEAKRYRGREVVHNKAAELGYADAQFILGVKLFDGQGVKQDYADALRWFRKAAVQGCDGAEGNA